MPEHAPARLWADGRYVGWVNGVEIARGPVRSDPRQAHYDVVDLAPQLRHRTNVIAVLVRRFGAATYSLGAGSWVFEAEVGGEWIMSDRSWRTAPGRAWTPVPVPGDVACLPLESFDAGRHDRGWQVEGFDDAAWSDATEITPMHTGGAAEPHPPSEPFGLLRPPVRVAFPGGARHEAPPTSAWQVPAEGELHPDPVAQLLTDQRREHPRHRQPRPGGRTRRLALSDSHGRGPAPGPTLRAVRQTMGARCHECG